MVDVRELRRAEETIRVLESALATPTACSPGAVCTVCKGGDDVPRACRLPEDVGGGAWDWSDVGPCAFEVELRRARATIRSIERKRKRLAARLQDERTARRAADTAVAEHHRREETLNSIVMAQRDVARDAQHERVRGVEEGIMSVRGQAAAGVKRALTTMEHAQQELGDLRRENEILARAAASAAKIGAGGAVGGGGGGGGIGGGGRGLSSYYSARG